MLSPEASRVWEFLSRQPALAGFVLVGGTGLALRLRHRRSDDFDLAFPAEQLPRGRIEALVRIAPGQGIRLALSQDEAAASQFLEAGLELGDYQQNYLANGTVKVSFFSPEPPFRRILAGPAEDRVRIASLPELFKTKCLVSALRSKSRDWLDLYLLLRNHGFSIRDYHAAFAEAGVDAQWEIGMSRLCSGVRQADDEGYAHLLPRSPTLEEMRDFFVAQRNVLEISLARDRSRAGQESAPS